MFLTNNIESPRPKQATSTRSQSLLDLLMFYTERVKEDMQELNKAHSHKDWTRVRFIVHRMRSTAITMGLKDLIAHLRVVEDKLKDEDLDSLRSDLDQICELFQNAIDEVQVCLELSRDE